MLLPMSLFKSPLFTAFCAFALIWSAQSASQTQNENETVSGESKNPVPENVTELKELAPLSIARLVSAPGKGKQKIVSCSAINVTFIQWSKGSSVSDSSPVTPCADLRPKELDSAESSFDLEVERGAPCTSNVTTEQVELQFNGTVTQHERKVLNLTLRRVRGKDFGPYTCFVIFKNSPSLLVPFSRIVYVQDKGWSEGRNIHTDTLLPLWVMMGMCGVLILLYIIVVVYEKLRSKHKLVLVITNSDGSPVRSHE